MLVEGDVRRQRQLFALVFAVLGGLAGAAFWSDLAVRALAPLAVVTLVAIGVAAAWSTRKVVPGDLEFDDHNVYLDGRKLVPRREIRSAGAVASDGVVRIYVERTPSWRDLWGQAHAPALVARAESLGEARAWLADLGFGERAQRLRLSSWGATCWWQYLPAAIIYFGGANVAFLATPPHLVVGVSPVLLIPAWAAIPAALALLVHVRLTQSVIEVGADGVEVVGRHRRFIPYSAIHDATVSTNHVALHLVGGETVRMLFGGLIERSPAFDSGHAVPRRILAARIRSACGAPVSHSACALPAAIRGGRSYPEWLRTGIAHTPFRTPTPDALALRDLLENGRLPERPRVDAAVALRLCGHEEHRLRIATAAQATASSHLRAILEAVANASDDDLSAALDHLEVDQEVLRRT